VSGAVLAGGASRRMGRDKRGIPVGGVPLLRRAALAVRTVAGDLVIVCRAGAPPDPGLLDMLDARVVFDRVRGGGPLAGLEAALGAARGELVVVVAADMPWIEPAVLHLLIAEAALDPAADVVAVGTERGPEPLLALYRRRIHTEVTRTLDTGERRMQALLGAVRLSVIPPERWLAADPTGRTPANMNTLRDVAAAGDDRP